MLFTAPLQFFDRRNVGLAIVNDKLEVVTLKRMIEGNYARNQLPSPNRLLRGKSQQHPKRHDQLVRK